jgi:23S rRNA (adenine2503-C2)-methyltransferase
VRPKNIVFMGMGEPMDNLDEVLQAIRVLTDRAGAGMAAANISVSTVGRVEGIRRYAEFVRTPGYRRCNLAVSLNAPNDEIRSSIMPINRKHPMAELREAMLAFPPRASSAICVEYVLIPGVNDRLEHCDELCAYLKGIRCSLNVIPYNPRRDSPWPAPREEDVEAFLRRALENGQFVKRRGTKGRSVMGACGQLGNPAIRRRRWVDLSVDGGS